MQIKINDDVVTVQADMSLADVVHKHVGTSTAGMAVALNGSVVPAASYQATRLKENDEILIITATQGG